MAFSRLARVGALLALVLVVVGDPGVASPSASAIDFDAAQQQPASSAAASAAQALAGEARPSSRSLAEGSEKAEKPVNVSEFALSTMLLGMTVTLIMLFYLTFNKDQDVRAATWMMVSVGCTIFLAVILFWAVKELCIRTFGKNLYVMLGLVVLSMACLQGGLLVAAKTKGEPLLGCRRSVIACMTFGGLLGHITGFAALSFWAEVQAMILEEHKNFWLIVAVVPLAWLVHLGVMRVCLRIRDAVVYEDELEDEEEKQWQETASEGLVEAGALMTSFIAMQVLRYGIGGVMPNPEGVEDISSDPRTWSQEVMLWSVGLAAGVAVAGITYFCGSDDVEDEEEEDEELNGCAWFKLRSYQLGMKFLTFLSALCFLYATDWTLESTLTSLKGSMAILVAVAMLTSYITFGVVLCIGRIDNWLLTRKSVAGHEAAENVLAALSVTVGFAWERCFDRAIEHFSEYCVEASANTLGQMCGPACEKLASWIDVMLALAITALLLPALYWYINPRSRVSAKKAQKYFESMLAKESIDGENPY
eukprot:TRINITY_DN32932_c0_g1_i1.p1 TRINITY_DN32932_c0_g1~~TRINITY_DN32932_c0_g1_i1.p1  ORF type:complete len:534 (+),score=137.84 TRINITY_DN32932_c0_g1_i1:57-1658(+)